MDDGFGDRIFFVKKKALELKAPGTLSCMTFIRYPRSIQVAL